jgi:amidophosphoribosyltransferase
MSDKFHDECGVFGIFGHPEASNLTYLGLYALQHRGQESCGIVSGDGKRLHSYKGMGLVSDRFKRDSIFDELPGRNAIGHVRYSTAATSKMFSRSWLIMPAVASPLLTTATWLTLRK